MNLRMEHLMAKQGVGFLLWWSAILFSWNLLDKCLTISSILLTLVRKQFILTDALNLQGGLGSWTP